MRANLEELLRARCAGNQLADAAMVGFIMAFEEAFSEKGTLRNPDAETLLLRGALQSVIDRFIDTYMALRYAPKKG